MVLWKLWQTVAPAGGVRLGIRYWLVHYSGPKPDWETPAKTRYGIARSPDHRIIRIPKRVYDLLAR